eukprot:TRINITY_DN19793_c0_g2_i1.p1 TRINITY_DN19793_c0_g2~~TRINITY_DN19793_c0_g2_i1.p1  ORF type:complete len:305 (+),score=88.54 TRINITY_DN19793_c0_g2_i1:215-1129(+)
MAAAPPAVVDPSQFVQESENGDIAIITYSEKLLAQKEAVLRKYIEETYAKTQSVEKELAALTLEVKLTSGSKKAALELLRRKIEDSAERIHAARTKEDAAKKAWEAASKCVADEESTKAKLCKDLNMMVQESAMQQYQKLQELTLKLDALNPNLSGEAYEVLEDLRAKIGPHGAPLLEPPVVSTPNPSAASSSSSAAPNGTSYVNPFDDSSAAAPPSGDASSTSANGKGGEAATSSPPVESAPHVPLKPSGGRGVGRGGRGLRGGRGGGSLVVRPGEKRSGRGGGDQWTGAGFDVQDGGGGYAE